MRIDPGTQIDPGTRIDPGTIGVRIDPGTTEIKIDPGMSESMVKVIAAASAGEWAKDQPRLVWRNIQVVWPQVPHARRA